MTGWNKSKGKLKNDLDFEPKTRRTAAPLLFSGVITDVQRRQWLKDRQGLPSHEKEQRLLKP